MTANVAIIANGQLLEMIEAEKDSGLRYAQLDLTHLLFESDHTVEAIAISGWAQGADPTGAQYRSGLSWT